MAKNPKVSDSDRAFTKKAKFIFSSTTARRAPYVYFGIAPQVVIMSNSTTPPPNKEHGDRLMSYSVGELGLHVTVIKDEDFFTQFKALVGIPDGMIYCANTLKILSLLNKYKIQDLHYLVNDRGETLLKPKARTTYDDRNLVGFPIDNFHIVSELMKWFQYTLDIGTPEHQARYPWVIVDVPLEPVMVGSVYFTEVDTDLFKDAEGNPVFAGVRPKLKVLNIDGLSIVSLKECVKKLQGTSYTLKQYLWAVQNAYVLSMTRFENDMVDIRSIRPNVLAMPIRAELSLTTENLFKLEESDV